LQSIARSSSLSLALLAGGVPRPAPAIRDVEVFRMKVVLFCGGQGFQLPGRSEFIPKPMATVGYRPMLWHVMRYYAHWDLTEFILCLGYGDDTIRNYFLDYNEALSNDFVLTDGGLNVELFSTDIDNWQITFVDTGLNANVGQRLKAVEHYVRGEEIFCANYADNLTDAPLGELVADFKGRNKVAAFLSVRPHYSFHLVRYGRDGLVKEISGSDTTDLWVNGGYFIFRNDIFQYIRDGEDLLEQPFRRLIDHDELISYRYEGFWTALDTLKDLQILQSVHDSGRVPWAPWAR
jgi:glucose-1-phosphate cytidylyltransferase